MTVMKRKMKHGVNINSFFSSEGASIQVFIDTLRTDLTLYISSNSGEGMVASYNSQV